MISGTPAAPALRAVSPILTGRLGPAVVAAVSLAFSAVFAALGPGYALDDWYALANARFDGSWMAAGSSQQVARPGAAAVYWLVFGVLGERPMAAFALQAAVSALTAALLVVLLRRFFPPALALVAALAWAVLPNHTSLEMWISAANIGLCVLLAVAATLALSSERRALPFLGLGLFGLAALSYEAVIPAAVALVVAVPWARRGRPDPWLVAAGAVVLGSVSGWVVTHWHPNKVVDAPVADMAQAVGAHLGWGIAPAGPVASILTVIGLGGIAVAIARLALPSWRHGPVGPPEVAVVVGLAVIVVGSLPFVRYPYAPLGAGDRYNFVSSIGGALVWAGIAAMAWAWRKPLAVGLVSALALAGSFEHVQRSLLWHRAGRDADAITAGILAAHPTPAPLVVLGPEPIQQQNIAAFVDQSNVTGALALAYDRRGVRAGIAQSVAQFETYPADQRFDIRPFSELVPDTAAP